MNEERRLRLGWFILPGDRGSVAVGLMMFGLAFVAGAQLFEVILDFWS